jgi:hypothetical protein
MRYLLYKIEDKTQFIDRYKLDKKTINDFKKLTYSFSRINYSFTNIKTMMEGESLHKHYFNLIKKNREDIAKYNEYLLRKGRKYEESDIINHNAYKTPEELKKEYLDKAKKLHPDLNPNDPLAKEKFQELQKDYEARMKYH